MHRLFELEDLVEKEIGKVVDAGCVQPSEWKFYVWKLHGSRSLSSRSDVRGEAEEHK